MKAVAIAYLFLAVTAFALPTQDGVNSVDTAASSDVTENTHSADKANAYYYSCTCTANGYRDDDTGYQACLDLHYQYPNLDWDGYACYDRAGQGVESHGFAQACVDRGNQGVYYDSLCFN